MLFTLAGPGFFLSVFAKIEDEPMRRVKVQALLYETDGTQRERNLYDRAQIFETD